MTIRKAAQEDHPSIYHLVRTAFATARVSDGTEQDFVLELRRRDTYRPELELVAEENGQLIGHILLTPLPVPGAPEGLRGLMAAPLCVRLEDRNRGLGGQLLHEGGRRAAELGYNALFLVGDPEYYAGGVLKRRLPGVPKRLRRARPVFAGPLPEPGWVSGGRRCAEPALSRLTEKLRGEPDARPEAKEKFSVPQAEGGD